MPLPPLPEGWSPSEGVADTIEIAGVTVFRVGVASVAPTGEELTGAAASLVASPGARAHFELLERIATFEAIAAGGSFVARDASGAATGTVPAEQVFRRSEDPTRYREARSSGIALHDSWEEAAFRARAELVERDHVLRTWYGFEAPRAVSLPDEAAWDLPRRLAAYDWRACAFEPAVCPGWSDGIAVRGIFALPRRDDLPLLVGFGARATPELALMAACAELTQSLAFLWGEEIPTTRPEAAPHAGAHLEWSLFPGNRSAIAAWLDGAHRAYAPTATRLPLEATRAEIVYADLTPPWLAGAAHVVRAMHPHARRLIFGESPDTAHLPPALRIHPIG